MALTENKIGCVKEVDIDILTLENTDFPVMTMKDVNNNEIQAILSFGVLNKLIGKIGSMKATASYLSAFKENNI